MPRPAPATAAVTASISGIPGDPFGPSYRITITSPGPILPPVTASKASFSESKGRARPRNSSEAAPAIFITLPSGASDPRRIAVPPSVWSGSLAGRTISPSGFGGARASRFSAIVLPVTVMQSPCSSPRSRSSCITTGTPPTRSRSLITKRPAGRTSTRCGTRRLIASKSSSSRSTCASRAIASRWRTAFVEPATAITTAIAGQDLART